jgi:hypothetical protein
MMNAGDVASRRVSPVVPGRLEQVFWVTVGVGVLALLWSALCTAPGVPWNAARMAPSFALARGLPIYALRDSGAHLGWFYGPVFPLWFLPFGFLENPTVALMLAAAWNALTMLLPIFLIVRSALGGKAGAAWRTTLFGAVLMFAHPITRSSFYLLHVDALCVAWVLAACVALQAAVGRGWRPGLPLAALAVALAIGTKQLAIVFVPATVVWLWREGQGRLVRAWLFWLVVCGGGLAAIFFFLFGPEQLLFNAWLLHSRNEWQGGWVLLVGRGWELVTTGWIWWSAAALAWVAARSRLRVTLGPEAGAMVRLLGWAAAWQLPFGLMASLKEGGGLNSVHALSYLLAAGLIAVGASLAREEEGIATKGGMRAVTVTLGIALLVLAADFRMAIAPGKAWVPYRGLEDLLVRAKASQGKLYLPWNPLITILSDGKIYPFDDALKSLWAAHLEPPVDAIRAAIPAGAVIFFQEPSQSKFVLNYFGPEVSKDAEPKRRP